MASLRVMEKRKNSDDVQIVSIGSSSSSSSNSTNNIAAKQKNVTVSSSSSVPNQLTQTQRKKITTLIATKPASTTGSSTLIDDDGTRFESRCENPECSAPTLISLVPTKPTPQFIQDPYVVQNPVLVNGFTTVFQIDGHAAKVTEVKSSTFGKKKFQTISPIYRIVPNTHAHIVNYVIVDANGGTLKKIKENDPATMKKLLESQVNSADQLLKKLMGLKKVEGKIVRPPMVVEGSVDVQLTPTAISTSAAATESTSKTDSIPTAPVLPIQILKKNSKAQKPVQNTPEILIQKTSEKKTVQPSKQQLPVKPPILASTQLNTAKSSTNSVPLTGTTKPNLIILEPRSPRKENTIIPTNQTTKITMAPTTGNIIPGTSLLRTVPGTSLPINISTGAPSTLITTAIPPGPSILSRTAPESSLPLTVSIDSTPGSSSKPVGEQIAGSSLSNSSAAPFSVSMLQNAVGTNPVLNPNPNTNPININALEKMQAELNELRETVKQLTQKRPNTNDEDQNDSKKKKL